MLNSFLGSYTPNSTEIFRFKHVKRTPGVHHETEKISNLLEQLGMPDVLSNTQKLIDMVTGFPPSADASP